MMSLSCLAGTRQKIEAAEVAARNRKYCIREGCGKAIDKKGNPLRECCPEHSKHIWPVD